MAGGFPPRGGEGLAERHFLGLVPDLKIIAYTPLQGEPGRVFWHRDLGLLTRGFRKLGHEAFLAIHPQPGCGPFPSSPSPEEPVLWISPAEAASPLWWNSQKPDLVILGLWTRPWYNPIRRAALSATSRVVERADSDGMRTASCGWRPYAQRRFDYFRDRTTAWPIALSVFFSCLYAVASLMATPWMEARLARTLRLLPALTVETPEATRLWKSLARKLGANPDRIHCVPHPIQTDLFVPDPAVERQNRVIAVGRWESYQKNLPLLLQTLVPFLNQHPDWSSLVLGSGLSPDSTHSRIRFSPPVSPRALAHHMQSSKIFISSSRYESFGLAAAEAMACGCLSLGPAGLVSSDYFRSMANVPWPQRGSLLEELRAAAACLKNDREIGPAGACRIHDTLAPEKIAAALLSLP